MESLAGAVWGVLTATGGTLALTFIVAIFLGIAALTLLFVGSAVVAQAQDDPSEDCAMCHEEIVTAYRGTVHSIASAARRRARSATATARRTWTRAVTPL